MWPVDVWKVLCVKHPVIILPWTRSWCLIEFFSVWIKLLPVNIYWFPAPSEPRSHSQDKNTSLLFILGQSLTSSPAGGGGRMFPPVCPGQLLGTLSAAAILCCRSLRAWKCVQPPLHSVSAAVLLGPRLKNAKGAAEKSGSAYLSGLMSKMLQSSGNLLQSGTHSLLLQRSLQRAEEREMKGMKNSCG